MTDLQYPVEIVSCPIVRECDGLAMSSRNMLLSAEETKAGTRIVTITVSGPGKDESRDIRLLK